MVFKISAKSKILVLFQTFERNHAFSALLRCGASLETALWDLGYRGRSQSLLVVYNPEGLRLEKEAEKVYAGRYQGENI